jgi:hypothetical protein
MQKVNPFLLPRPERTVYTRVFDADGVSVELAFRKPDAADMNRAAETARRLVSDFITGYPEEGTPAADFYDGIKVSESLFLLCASAEEMQPPEVRLYTATDFVLLLDRLPTDGPRIAAFIRELQQDWRASPGNSRALRTETPSAEPSTSPIDIPNLNAAATSSSTRLTSASENSAGAVGERTPART